MPAHRRLVVYLVLFGITAGIAAPAVRLVTWAWGAWVCASNQPAGTFTAVCSSEVFGDYERGAYFYGLESEALAYLRAANVLFIGSSRVQFALSTDEVQQYFAARQVPYYVFGFAAGDWRIPHAILPKHNVRPKMLVVAPDPFFAHEVAQSSWLFESELSFKDRLLRRFDYEAKKRLLRIAPRLCAFHSLFCSTRPATVLYRLPQNGMWEWRGHYRLAEDKHVPAPPPVVLDAPNDRPDLEEGARQFLQMAGVRAECLVLTVTPDLQYNRQFGERFVRELAAKLGATAIVPEVDGMTMLDEMHLTWSSAQRWSAAFLAEFGPAMRRCVQ